MRSSALTPFLLSSVLLLAAASFGVGHQSILSPAPTPCSATLLPPPKTAIPFNTSSLLCSKVWPSEDFVLMFKHSDDFQKWSFVLSTPKNDSYISVGFSTNGMMVGSSAVAGWLAGGKGTVKQYLLSGMTPDMVKPDAGDLKLVKGSTAIVSQPSRMYLAFELDTSTDQPKNQLIYAIGPPGELPGSDYLLSMHRAYVSTSITFVPEHNEPTPSPDSAPEASPPEVASNETETGKKSPATNSKASGKLNLERLGVTTATVSAILLALGLL